MDYIIEQFDIDMRKSNLYMKSAISEYVLECDEVALMESRDSDVLITEASETLLQRVKQFFVNLIQKIKEFFQKIVERLRSIFGTKNAEKISTVVKSNPKLSSKKVAITDIKSIEDTYGKRKLLCKALEKKLKSGKLSQDDIDATVDKYDKLGKGVKVVSVALLAALTLVTGGLIIKKMNKCKDDTTEDTKSIANTTTETLNKTNNVDRVISPEPEPDPFFSNNEDPTPKSREEKEAELEAQKSEAARQAQQLAQMAMDNYNNSMAQYAKTYDTIIKSAEIEVTSIDNLRKSQIAEINSLNLDNAERERRISEININTDMNIAQIRKRTNDAVETLRRKDSKHTAALFGIPDPLA